MRLMKRRGIAGVTLTELMVVLVIVGLLATIAVPAMMGRSLQAKYAVARAECENLARAEEMCGMTHGFYVPLQLLDNVPDFSGFNPQRDDTISNIPAGMFLISVDQSASDQITFGQLDMNSNNIQVERLKSEWDGPFINFQRPYLDPAATTGVFSPSTTIVQFDHPLDPWGNPYRLYSPEGITGSNAGTNNSAPPTSSDLTSPAFSNGNLTTQDDRFDRYAIVSFGPNGQGDFTPISGGTTTPFIGDDIIYFFGTNPRDLETTIGGSGAVTASPTP